MINQPLGQPQISLIIIEPWYICNDLQMRQVLHHANLIFIIKSINLTIKLNEIWFDFVHLIIEKTPPHNAYQTSCSSFSSMFLINTSAENMLHWIRKKKQKKWYWRLLLNLFWFFFLVTAQFVLVRIHYTSPSFQPCEKLDRG